MNSRLYTIKEASARTGLSTQLIRKWEERYGAVTPSRFPNGYRGYTTNDIETLLRLKKKVEDGVPIGLAVQEQLLLNGPGGTHPEAGAEDGFLGLGTAGMEAKRDKLVECLLQLDSAGARRSFDELLALYRIDYVLLEVVAPVLVDIGSRWERGEISEFQEHFSSHFIRERLLAIKSFYHHPGRNMPLVTACAPTERHELGILMLGLFAEQAGLEVMHLGASPSEKGIFDCLDALQPAAFAFGASSEEVLQASEGFFRELDRRIEECRLATKVFIGGRVVEEDGRMHGTSHVHYISGCGLEAVGKIRRLLLDG